MPFFLYFKNRQRKDVKKWMGCNGFCILNIYDAASLRSLAPSQPWMANDDEVGVQSADGVSDSHVRVQLHLDWRPNKFDNGFQSVDDYEDVNIQEI